MNDRTILVDWLSITGHFSSFNEMFDLLGISDTELVKLFKAASGRNFFSSGLCFTYHGKQIMSFYLGQTTDDSLGMIDLSGQGMRFFESYSKLSVPELLEVVNFSDDLSVTRIDLAYDIKSEEYPIEKFVKYYENGDFVSRAHYTSIIKSDNNGVKGTSIYFGKQGSDTRINIYDKRSERGLSADDLPSGWIRIETRLRHNTAKSFIAAFCEGVPLSDLYIGVLSDKLRFVKHSKDSNKRRVELAPWWKKLLGDCERITLSQPGTTYEYGKWEDGMFKQCGSSILTYLSLHTPQQLIAELRARKVEINSTQQFIIDNYITDVTFYELGGKDDFYEEDRRS